MLPCVADAVDLPNRLSNMDYCMRMATSLYQYLSLMVVKILFAAQVPVVSGSDFYYFLVQDFLLFRM